MNDDTDVTPELIQWLIINSIDAVDDYEGYIDDLEMVEMAVILNEFKFKDVV